MKKNTFSLFLFTILLSFNLYSQTPANNDCADATLMTFGAQYSDTVAFATNSVTSSSCGFGSGTGDVWYEFIVPSTGEFYLNLNGGGLLRYAIFSDCTATNELTCGNGDSGELLITSLQAGATYYMNIAKIPLACKGDCDFDFTLTLSEQTLSKEEFTINTVSYYPNPVTNQLIVNSKHIMTSVEVYNVIGKKIKTAIINSLNTKIDLSNFQSGVYFISVISSNKQTIFKIIKD